MENQKDAFLESRVNLNAYDDQVSENVVNEEWDPVNVAEGGDLPIQEQVATEIDDAFFEGLGLPDVPRSECGGGKFIIPVSDEEQCLSNQLLPGYQSSPGFSSQTQDKGKRKRAPSPQTKRLALMVRVNMPRLEIYNLDFCVEVDASDKIIVLRQKLRDIARAKRFPLPLDESYFFIHLQDGIDDRTHHIPLVNRIETLSFEEAGFIPNGSTILAVSPCFAYLHPDTQRHLFCRDCAGSSKKS